MVKKTRVIDYKFFHKCNFSFISTIDDFGQTKFLKLNYPVHENLIRAFYNNAICVELDDVVNINYVHEIITFVIGKTIVVNQESLASLLGIPNEKEINEEQPFPDTIRTIKNQA